MADVVFTEYKHKVHNGTINPSLADFRVVLLQACSDINPEDTTVADVLARPGTTELTSNSYARKTLTNVTITKDTVNHRSELHADNLTYETLSQASDEQIQGILIIVHNTNDAGSTPVAFFDRQADAKVPDGNYAIIWDAEGILQI